MGRISGREGKLGMLTYRVLNAVMFGRHCLLHFSFYEISHNNFQTMLLDVIVCTFHTVFLHLNDALTSYIFVLFIVSFMITSRN